MGKSNLPSLETRFAGLKFRSPIGVGPVGSPIGANVSAEAHAEVLLKHVEAGAAYIYVPARLYATEESIRKVKEHNTKPDKVNPQFPPGWRTVKLDTPMAPYGVEGALWLISHPCWIGIEGDRLVDEHSLQVMEILKKRKPKDVPLIANTRGYGDLPDTYVDGAKFWEEQGADLIEVNLSCPAAPAMTGGVEEFLEETFTTRWPGALIGQIPHMVENITREVVKAVKIPVGVKVTPETGFPAIVGLARRIRDAGARFISVFNCAVSIAPPDIYNRGKPIYPFLDGHAFAGGTGSWLRMICYRDVAAIARFVPGIDITAAGGIVMPAHCVEMMMLGAQLLQLTTGVIEQGRGLLRRSTSFLEKFMTEQGYRSTEEIIGLAQQHIKYLDELDMLAGKVKAITDETKCTNCGVCADGICIVRHMEDGKLIVDDENCIGCGTCLLACRQNAIRLEK